MFHVFFFSVFVVVHELIKMLENGQTKQHRKVEERKIEKKTVFGIENEMSYILLKHTPLIVLVLVKVNHTLRMKLQLVSVEQLKFQNAQYKYIYFLFLFLIEKITS